MLGSHLGEYQKQFSVVFDFYSRLSIGLCNLYCFSFTIVTPKNGKEMLDFLSQIMACVNSEENLNNEALY